MKPKTIKTNCRTCLNYDNDRYAAAMTNIEIVVVTMLSSMALLVIMHLISIFFWQKPVDGGIITLAGFSAFFAFAKGYEYFETKGLCLKHRGIQVSLCGGVALITFVLCSLLQIAYLT